jgi:FAD/FMN-containing dehydrogenase/Fe-S oxidoreductase
VKALERELRDALEGEVRFDDGSRALYATDASNYRQLPIGVVLPRTADDVERTVALCRRHGAPLLSRGGGTSLAGQCCNAAVLLDFSRYMNRILEIDPERRLARVEPGVVLDDLRDAAEEHGLTFGPDPATHDHCTIGGMIGNNSCGVHALMAGKTVDNIEELTILTYDGLRMRVGATPDDVLEAIRGEGGRRGEIYAGLARLRDRYAERIRERYPDIPRRVSGYNLDELLPEQGFHVARALVGSESTCVTVLEATCRLVPSPTERVLVVLGFDDVARAADRVPEVLEYEPIGLEGIDERLIGYMKKKGMNEDDLPLLPEGGGWLLVELGADDPRDALDRARELMGGMEKGGDAPSMQLYDDPAEQKKIWEIRESGLGATANVPGEPASWPGWEDAAVPPESLGAYLRDFRELLDRHGYGCSLYGHFGQGCVHTRIDFDLTTRGGIDSFRSFLGEAAELVVRYGGSLSGEHGDGQARAELLPAMFGEEICQAFDEFKTLWDPDGRMNPGKVVRAHRVDENLRLGTDYRPPALETHFAFPDDGGSFAAASRRCVGVGKCRRMDGGIMCPSYRATREEAHSTRGRSRLLFEVMSGRANGTNGWRDESMREALDLCLACKGCKSDCPVDVDMATYKAEFLSHYYEGRLRPRSAYAFGLIGRWSRLGGRLPRLANFGTRTPGVRALTGWLAGAAPQRRLPAFARQSFRHWYLERGTRNPDGPPVLLWPDTFNDHFRPHTAQAATQVLEQLGHRVVIPPRPLCCGRPLYDYGMLGTARRWLEQILEVLRPHIAAGIPLVGLEPSCVTVFRDELRGLLPHDEDGRRLGAQSFALGEFLERQGTRWPGSLSRSALVQPHCHQQSVLGQESEDSVLRRVGLDLYTPEAGCCGMAGAFGFEREHYDVSMRVAERALLPAVRDLPDEALIVADGFSCREQIAQATSRRALHLAEVLHASLRQASGETLPRALLEREYWGREQVPELRTSQVGGPSDHGSRGR